MRASANDLELWHVQFGGGVRTMTLDELDAAFQAGTIDEHTLVLKAGALQWTTLADVAGLDDEPVYEQPNSIAPMATDIGSGSLSIPPLAPVNFDVSFGTEELAVFRPKRSVGRVFLTMALVAMVGGGLFAVNSYGVSNLKTKVASITSIVKTKAGGEAARAAAIAPPPAAAPPPSFNAPPMNNAPSVAIDSLPPAAEPTSSTDDTSTDKAGKSKGKKRAEPAAKKAKKGGKKKGAKSSDPTQRGSGQFDPLDGSL